MKPKITVQTSIWRPGYIDSITQALKDQTLTDFELILIDDLWEQRKDVVKEYIGNAFPFKHIPPRELSPYAMPCAAMNTGLIHAEGELIYLMNDYMYIHPRTLERHWEIYSKYGPKVLISGPLGEPTPIPLKDNFNFVIPENLISIFREPFRPVWPEALPPDWRLSNICKVLITENLYENDDNAWFWAGR
ncbi:unnamed protein product, partial [marine sediment metagenome]